MTIAPEADAVPTPTWHGSPPDAPQRYLAFVKDGRNERLRDMIAESERKVEAARADLADYTQAIETNRRRIIEQRNRLAEVRQDLNDLPTPEELQAEVERIKAIPNVFGIRVDSDGTLVVHVRTYVTYEGSRVDLGDFEICFEEDLDYTSWPVVYTRVPTAPGGDHDVGCRRGFEREQREGSIYYGYFKFNRADAEIIRSLLASGVIYEALVLMLSRMCSIDEDFIGCFQKLAEGADPSPTWRGYMDELTDGLHKTIDRFANGPVRVQIAEAQHYIDHYEAELRKYADRVREKNTQIRQLEAEVQELRSQQHGEIDERAVLQELRYIKGLPGVMGVRFNEYGIPVFHIRTSHVLENRRYDLGDFEVALTEEGCLDPRGVVSIHQTRSSRGRREHLFFHAERGTRADGAAEGWFCFGGRSSDLTRLFRRGEFGQMMHLLVNTMNGVNRDYRRHDTLNDYYREIPMNAVWRTRRNRPRRRPRGVPAQQVAATVDQPLAVRTVPPERRRRLAQVLGGIALRRG